MVSPSTVTHMVFSWIWIIFCFDENGVWFLNCSPREEVNVLQDGGSAETSTGQELGGGVRLSYPAWRLKEEMRTQGLVIHSADGFTRVGAAGVGAGWGWS